MFSTSSFPHPFFHTRTLPTLLLSFHPKFFPSLLLFRFIFTTLYLSTSLGRSPPPALSLSVSRSLSLSLYPSIPLLLSISLNLSLSLYHSTCISFSFPLSLSLSLSLSLLYRSIPLFPYFSILYLTISLPICMRHCRTHGSKWTSDVLA